MLPASLGGLGLLAAERIAPAAYWASWADALPVLQPPPDAAARCVQELEAGAEGAAPCLRAAAAAGQRLDREGWEERPTWLAAKTRHPMATNPVWVCQAGRDMLLSHFTRPFETRWFCRLPTPAPGRCCDPSQARMPARGFLPYPRMPRPPLRLTSCISLCGAVCASRSPSREHAVVGMASMAAAELSMRWATTPRPALVQACWRGEALCLSGHGSKWHAKQSGQKAERFLNNGLPTPQHPVALCCDATLVSTLTRNGLPANAADSRDGAAIAVARRRKAARYPELGRGGPQRLCVLAAEVGDRWGVKTQQLVRQLVRLRGRRAPTALRAAAVAVQRAVPRLFCACMNQSRRH